MKKPIRHEYVDSHDYTYKWREGSNLPVGHASIVGPVIQKLDREGRATAEALVAEASKEDSPLRECFEMNDQRAAHLWRVDKARAYLQQIVFVKIGESRPVEEQLGSLKGVPSSLVSGDAPTESERRVYVPREDVATNPKFRAFAYAEALNNLRAWRMRVKIYAEQNSDADGAGDAFQPALKGIEESIELLEKERKRGKMLNLPVTEFTDAATANVK